MPKARVYVTLKKSVFDPQGRTIHEALRSMGYEGVADVRQGKFFEVDLESMPAERARETVDEIARRVLSWARSAARTCAWSGTRTRTLGTSTP